MADREGKALVDEYLAQIPPKLRAALQRLRKQIRTAAPEATEGIAYGMPTFRHRVGLVAFRASGSERCSFHVMSPAVTKAHRAELEGREWSGATIHFAPDETLPDALVKKIVRARIAENEAAAEPIEKRPKKPLKDSAPPGRSRRRAAR